MTPPLRPTPSPCVALFLVLAGFGAAPAHPGAAQASADPDRPPDATAADTLAGLWDSPTPRTTIVEVDGYDVRIRTAAPHPDRIPGRPLVVLEAGFGSTVEGWGDFVEEVAGLAPLVAYDRAGIGASEWDESDATFEHVTGRLRRLLEEIGAEPPFVLVGHSFGGDLVRYFARFHPGETVGLVLLDPVTNSPADFGSALEEIGAARERMLEIYDGELGEDVPPGVRAESELVGAYFREGREFDLPRPTDIPVSILFAGLDAPPDGDEVYGFDVSAHITAWERRKIARLGEWIMQVPLGEMILVPSSGHFVHLDEPELALEAVRRVLFPAIPRVLLQELDARGPDAAVARYHEIEAWYPPDRFHEDVLNDFGYRLLRAERPEDAIPFFLLNREEYPDALNPWDSLADGYRAAGRSDLEEETRARLLELAEERRDPRAGVYRERLARVRAERAGGG
ncbi:MAG TPA: alpha/beta fold hydrolase [Longimicrobiales bacterium]|nr:alpha/beta fold hydrolase [Longimicrobiales bacterium]